MPAGEKLVSLFEEHADIVVKDSRDTEYGHKILCGGWIATCALAK